MERMQNAGPLAKLQRRRRRWGLLTLLAVAPAMISCYGSFPLTHGLLRINGQVSNNGVIQSIVTWIFVLLPVYWFAEVIDFLVMNLIEFWSGDTISLTQGTDANGNTVTLVPSADGQTATLTVSRDGKTIQEGQFVKASNGDTIIVDAAGQRQARVVKMEDGSLEIRNMSGRTIKTIPADVVRQAHEKAAASKSAGAMPELAPVF